jgi:hypothetical protein
MPIIDKKMLTNCKDLICVLKFCFEKIGFFCFFCIFVFL